MKFGLKIASTLLLLFSTASHVVSGQYAVVKGWEINLDDNRGCTATHPSYGDIGWDILVAPAGGWEIRLDDLAGHANDQEFPARIVVDNQEFHDTFFSYNGTYIGLLPLEQRLAMAKGSQVTFLFDNMELQFSLSGSTAAMLKLEECWHRLTGYNAATSSRAGSYAFK